MDALLLLLLVVGGGGLWGWGAGDDGGQVALVEAGLDEHGVGRGNIGGVHLGNDILDSAESLKNLV